jgi:hypothetical protein
MQLPRVSSVHEHAPRQRAHSALAQLRIWPRQNEAQTDKSALHSHCVVVSGSVGQAPASLVRVVAQLSGSTQVTQPRSSGADGSDSSGQ